MDPDAEWIAERLVESDRRYFELAARTVDLPGAQLCMLPGLEALAAGCVVQRVDERAAEGDPIGWLDCIESAFASHAVRVQRIYLTGPCPALEDLLQRRGYRESVEVGFALDEPKPPPLLDVELLRVETSADWETKERLQARWPSGPDGHPAEGAQWIEMERRRCGTGEMEPFLVLRGGEAVGAVNVMQSGAFLRIKNLVVAREQRSSGVGSGAVRLIAGVAAERGCAAVGCFAIRGRASERTYAVAGYSWAGVQQVEWSRVVREGDSK